MLTFASFSFPGIDGCGWADLPGPVVDQHLPGLAILSFVLPINVVGDRVRDLLDPRVRNR